MKESQENELLARLSSSSEKAAAPRGFARALLACPKSINFQGKAAEPRAGFAIAPILYLLGLVGVGAGVLFSGYSQVLRSNVNITNNVAARNELAGAATTLAATAELSSNGLLFCPPRSSTSTGFCDAAPIKMDALGSAEATRLPTNAALAGTTGSPTEAGVFAAGAGLKQLDPWGHYYIYCRWENSRATADQPAFTLISGGADKKLDTKCGDTTVKGDDQMVAWAVGEAIQRAAVWQANGSSDVRYGATGSQVLVTASGAVNALSLTASTLLVTGTTSLGSLSLTTPLPVASGGTGAADATNARANLGSTTVGDAVFIATTATAGRTALGGTGMGQYLFSSSTLAALTASDVRNILLGASGVGDTVFTSDAPTGRAALGSSTVGDAVFVAATATAARTALGATTMGDYLFSSDAYVLATASEVRGTLLGGTTVGSAVFTAANAASARSALGGGAVGSPLFTAADQPTAWSILGLTGSSGTLNVNITGEAGSVPASGITGVVAISQGGTSANNATDARANLGANNATNLTTGTLDWNRLPNSTVTAGAYNWGTVDQKGRVTFAQNISTGGITDGEGDQITASAGYLYFMTSSVIHMTLDPSGYLGIGTQDPQEMLHLNGGNIRISGAAETSRELQFATGTGSERWTITTNATAEGGSNAGSDFTVNRYTDAGALAGTPFSITRSTGNATFANALTVTGALYGSSATFSGTVSAAGGFIGDLTGNVIGGISGTLSLQDGTAAAPSLFFTNDTNVGLYRPGNDAMSFVTAGTDRLYISATGSVGIGTTTPAQMLDVNGNVNVGAITNGYYLANSKILGQPASDTTSLAVGASALASQTATNGHNTAVGYQALYSNTTGYRNTANGYQALYSTTTGYSNTAVGFYALYSNTSGWRNTAHGMNALQYNTEGNNNAAFGATTLSNNTTGSYNIAIGNGALSYNTTGSGNVAMGHQALYSATPNNLTGNYNIGIGIQSLMNVQTTADSNTALGYNTGATLTTGGSNILIGAGADVPIATSSNRLNIGDTIYGDLSTKNIGIGSATITTGAGLDLSSRTGVAASSLLLPKDTTANRPTVGVTGMVRYNTTTNMLEAYAGATPAWASLLTSSSTFGSGIYLGTSTAATNPSRSDDVTTGLFSDTASTVAIATAGVEALRVTATGSVGVGTTTPAQMLDVNGNVNVGAITNGYYLANSKILSQPASDTTSLAVGASALASQTVTNKYNTAVGYQALYSNTTGWRNTANGYQALYSTTTGFSNAAAGYRALYSNTSGWRNTAHGMNALAGNTEGNSNGAIGTSALQYNTIGSFNVSVGDAALYYNTTGSGNTAIGFQALYSATPNNLIGNYNTGVGYASLQNAQTTAASNTALGYNTGATLTTGGSNILIGAGADVPIATSSSRLNIGDTIYGDLSTKNIGIGSATITTGAGLDLSSRTGVAASSLLLPKDTTANRPTVGVTGMVRYNTTTNAVEAYQGSTAAWASFLTSSATFGSGIYLGTSTAATNPSRSDDVTTGLFSDTASTVAIATAGVERLRVTATGSVGIGMTTPAATFTTPAATFDVFNPTQRTTIIDNNVVAFVRGTWSDGDITSIAIGNNNALPIAKIAVEKSVAGSNIHFLTSENYTTGITRNALTIKSDGNIGIGTATPSRKLDVNGNINVTEITGGYYIANSKIMHMPASDSSSIALGSGALASQTVTNMGNTAVGVNTLYSTTTGPGNTAIGNAALYYNTTGSYNTANGVTALYLNTTGQYNTASGHGALAYGTSGVGNTAVGFYAMLSATPNNLIGNYNTGVGYASLQNVQTTAASNTALGYNTGATLTTGGSNILIGAGADVPIATSSSRLNIGNTIYGDLATDQISIGSATITEGAGLDLSSRTGAAASSLLLPKDTTANRPTVGVTGMVRYNTTTNAVEAYQGGTPAWATLLSTSATFGSGIYLGTSTAATNPSRSDDVTTGLFSDTASTVAIATAGVERLRVTASGSVGVGTTTPAQKLEVNGIIRTPQLSIGGNDTGQNRLLTYSSSGPTFRVFNTSAGYATFGMRAISVGSSYGAYDAPASGAIFEGSVLIGSSTDDGTNKLQVTGGITIPLANSYKIAGNAVLYQPASDTTSLAVGTDALTAQTATGLENTAVGYQALQLTTTGYSNTAVGYQALQLTTTGHSNTAVGVQALKSTSIGYKNTAVGYGTLKSNTSGNGNAAVGWGAMALNTTGGGNTAMGRDALYYNSDGMYNAAYGYYALANSTNGASNNTAIGDAALMGSSATGAGLTGNYNTAVGSKALYAVQTTAANNTAVGYNAGGSITTGASNVIFGQAVGSTTLITGSNNILIGTSSAVDTPAAATNSWLNIGNIIFGDMATNRVSIGSATITAGAGLDLSSRTGAAASSLILPKDTSANRPTTGVTGMVRYNTTTNAVEAYQGSSAAWATLLSTSATFGSGIYLGTSTAATNPSRSDDVTTGLFSSTASTVSIATSGVERLRVTATGSVGIGTAAPVKALDVSSTTGVTLYASTATVSSTSSTTNWLRAPKGAVSVFIGDSDSTAAYGVDEFSGDIRFNGLGNNWGDFGYYPTGSTSWGQFRLSLTGANVATTPNATLGVGGLLVNGRAGIGSATLTNGAGLDMSSLTTTSNSSLRLPVATSANRPTGAVGMIRYNSTTNAVESYQGSTPAWASFLTSAATFGSGIYLGTSTAATNPSRSDDVTTGLFSATASTVSIATSGVEALRVSATGSVGIGNTGPGKTLWVQGDAAIANAAGGGPATLWLQRYTGFSNAVGSIVQWNTAGDLNFYTMHSGGDYGGYNFWLPTGTSAGYFNIYSSAGTTLDAYNTSASTLFTVKQTGNVGIGSATITAGAGLDLNALTATSNSSLRLPVSTTALRPTTGAVGMLRYNSTLNAVESYQGSTPAWATLLSTSATFGSGIYLGTSTAATNPSRSNDVTTGLFSDTASTVAIATAGVEALRVTATGSVGIGTTTPGQKFHVSGGSMLLDNAQALQFKDGGGTARTALYYSAGNNMQLWNTASTGSVQIGISNASNTTGAVAFYYGNTTEAMRITATGSVGIGTTTAATKLHVLQNAANGSVAQLATIDGDTLSTTAMGSGLTIGFIGSSDAYFGAVGGYGNGASTGIGLWGGTGSGAPGLYLGSAGNVGIGTATPAQKLDVSGNINVSEITSGYYLANSKILGQPASDTTSIAVGPSALASQTATNLYNSALGYESLNKATAGYNAAGGWRAMYANTSGSSNTAFGVASLDWGTTGSGNVAIGYAALLSATPNNLTGNYNTGIGHTALQNVQTTAASNTALGYNTGATLTTGGSNILIGAGADVPIATSSSRLNIGNTIYGDLATDQISIGSATITEGAGLDLNALTAANNSSLRLPVSTTALRPTTGATGMMRYNSTTNLFEFYQNGAWVNYTSVSDARLKTDVQPVKGALDKVAALQPITFKWDTKNPRAAGLDDGKRHVGFLAQDLEKILPEVVNTGADSYRSVEYGQIVAVAVGAIKELKSENETLRQEMKSLRETSGGKDQNPAQAVSDKTLLLVAYVGGGLGLILLGGMAGLGLMLVRTRREVRRLGGLS